MGAFYCFAFLFLFYFFVLIFAWNCLLLEFLANIAILRSEEQLVNSVTERAPSIVILGHDYGAKLAVVNVQSHFHCIIRTSKVYPFSDKRKKSEFFPPGECTAGSADLTAHPHGLSRRMAHAPYHLRPPKNLQFIPGQQFRSDRHDVGANRGRK